jgi:predicted component of type VI protein secretion system
MTKLVIFSDDPTENAILEEFDLTGVQRMLIGSSPDNDLVLEVPDIDPAHASLEFRHDHWVLQDLGGPGGTQVNGQTIAGPYILSHADLLELGPVKLRFDAPDSAPHPKSDDDAADIQPEMRGRVWFAGVAGFTLAFIFVIIFLLVVADYLDVINITDLLPPWFG